MITERVFNIFLYFENGVARDYGVRHHAVSGVDGEKTSYLQSCVNEDFPIAQRFRLARSFTLEQWRAAIRLGGELVYFEEAFQLFRASPTPIYCLTMIVDGNPMIDQRIPAGPFRGDVVSAQEGQGAVPDYLVNYVTGSHFRFTELINDDYFHAIRTLFNEKLYVSCAKLLMSCIDTLAFVEFGATEGNFERWLDAFVDLKPQGITSTELWEFRNSVLHMTNLASRKVLAGKVSPIMPYVGGPDSMLAMNFGMPKPFNLHGLIQLIGAGIGKWAETYNSQPEKMLMFIERYDTTISDGRMAWFHYQDDASTE